MQYDWMLDATVKIYLPSHAMGAFTGTMGLARTTRLVAVLAMVLCAAGVVTWQGAGRASAAGSGGVYYVSPTGSDSAAGTQSAPWATIAHAQSAVQAGDTVYVRGGTYPANWVNADDFSLVRTGV